MSVQAMSWALALPKDILANPTARHVLLCLANYAGPDGRGAFPSAATLSDDTGLSERTVRQKLEELRSGGWIEEGNQAIAAAHIDRRDRRPVVYDLLIKRGAADAPRARRGEPHAPRERGAADGTGCSSRPNGVQLTAERGAGAAPNPSINHQLTEEQQQRAIQDAIAAQDRQALDQSVDERQRFPMFAAFQPNSHHLITQAQIAGVEPSEISDEVIRRFKGFFAARPDKVDSAAGWCHRLVSWFQRERAKNADRLADVDFDDTTWADRMEGL